MISLKLSLPLKNFGKTISDVQPFNHSRLQPIALVVLLRAVFFSMLWTARVSLASAVSKVGRIDALPAGGKVKSEYD
jgi:hypothetical protein